jgi:hypothetical protein
MITDEVHSEIARLLETPDSLLTGLDKQRRWMIAVHLSVRPRCWHCHKQVGYYDAIDDPEYKLGHEAKRYTCPHCKMELKHLVPYVGEWSWGPPDDFLKKVDEE